MYIILNVNNFILSGIDVNGEPYIFHENSSKALKFEEKEAIRIAAMINAGLSEELHVRISKIE